MGFKDAGKPHYLGHRERLRRRFREAGPDALPDYELLELNPVPRRAQARHQAAGQGADRPLRHLRRGAQRAGRAVAGDPGRGRGGRHGAETGAGGGATLDARRGAGAAGAVLLGAGARLLPRLDGVCQQGAVPHAVVHARFLLAVQRPTLHVPDTSRMRPS